MFDWELKFRQWINTDKWIGVKCSLFLFNSFFSFFFWISVASNWYPSSVSKHYGNRNLGKMIHKGDCTEQEQKI